MSFSKFLLGVVGVYTSYLVNSYLMQKIFTYQYPLAGREYHKDYFVYSDLVQLISNIFCLAYARASMKVKNEAESPIPFKQVLILGLLYCINVSTINYSLYYIPYPVRVVGDKLVYLTAVVIGVYFSRVSKNSKYKLEKKKIGIAIVITIGTLLFSYSYQVSKQSQTLYDPNQMWKGFVLLGISVIAESLFSDSQAFNKTEYKPSMNHILSAVNSIGIVFSVSSLLIKSQLSSSIIFCLQHKEIAVDLLSYSTLTIIGQISTYTIILNFKQHMFPLISTTRKIFTVLLSIYIYNHPTNVWIWVSLLLVFGGIVYQLIDELYFDSKEDSQKILKPKVQKKQ